MADRQDYLLHDKNLDMYLVRDSYLLNDFIGTSVSNTQIPAMLLSTLCPSNIKITLQRTDNNPVLNNGDWFQINATTNRKYFNWRLIVNNGNCCNLNDNCQYVAPKIRAQTLNTTFTKCKETTIVDLTFDKYIKFEEGDFIKISTNKFRNIIFKIDAIYDYQYKDSVKIRIIDSNSYYFKDFKDNELVEIEYQGDSYFYSYISTTGTLNDIYDNIEYALNGFNSSMFEVDNLGKYLIIRTKFNKTNIPSLKFDYNFSRSQTPVENFKINDVHLPITTYNCVPERFLYSKNRYRGIEFTGSDGLGTGRRFAISKAWADEFLSKDLLILTNSKYVPIVSYTYNDTIISHSNYLEQPTIVNGKVIEYKNIDKYIVCTLQDYEKLRVTSSRVFNVSYPYKPKVTKINMFSCEHL